MQGNKYVLPVVIAIVVLVGLGIGAVIMQSRSTNPMVSVSPQATATPSETLPTSTPITDASATPMAEAGNVQVVAVEAGSFYFKPNEIRVKKGQKVKIELKSVSMMHDFVIDELSVRVPVTQSGKTGTVEFTADKMGRFTFYCSVGNHRAQGQVGTLIVE